MEITCSNCSTVLMAPDELAGQSALCPNCNNSINVPTLISETPVVSSYKPCPYCREQILSEAIKCKHCGEHLTKQVLAETTIKVEHVTETAPQSDKFGRIFKTIAIWGILTMISAIFRLYPISIVFAGIGIIWTMKIASEYLIICPNLRCGYTGKADIKQRGSILLLIILFCFFVIPGIIYLLIGFKKEYYCPKCKMKIG